MASFLFGRWCELKFVTFSRRCLLLVAFGVPELFVRKAFIDLINLKALFSDKHIFQISLILCFEAGDLDVRHISRPTKSQI